MKRLLLMIVLSLAITLGASGQQMDRSYLLWLGADIGYDGTSIDGGLNLAFGFLATPKLYINVVAEAFGTTSTSALLAAGVRYFPFRKGFALGVDAGAGAIIPPIGITTWCLAASGVLAYEVGWFVLGLKAKVYFDDTPQASFGIFVDLSGEGARLALVAIGAVAAARSSSFASVALNSTIVGSFSGLSYGALFQLSNGQTWQQTEYYYYYHYHFYPQVYIWTQNGYFLMKVEGIDHAVAVRRIG